MERIFGLSRLIVFTAAGSLADAAIPGLRTQDAEYLRDELSRRGWYGLDEDDKTRCPKTPPTSYSASDRPAAAGR